MSSYYDVRVKWPGGYGGGCGRLSKERADEEVEKMIRMGYGRKNNPIHVLVITEPKVVRVVDDAAPTEATEIKP